MTFDARMSFFGRLVTGFKAFREVYLQSGLQDIETDFNDYESRRLRYEMYWAFYENTAYRDIHKWSLKFKSDYALYRHIRNLYNPSYRLGEFWKMHLMGGIIDPEAGSGKGTTSALPIIIPERNRGNDEALRTAIAQVWTWSFWQARKDLLCLWGPILGDVFLMVVDDVDHQQVFLDVVHPGKIRQVSFDAKGNVKAYVLAEQRYHPDNPNLIVSYMEKANRDGENVVYETFLNGEPWPWNPDLGATWLVPYGFIPMVAIKHNDVGLDWGWSELHAGRIKFQELDDLTSKIHDHVRKLVDPAWFFSGVSKSKADAALSKTRTEATSDRPAPEREELTAIYATNPQARANALVANLDLASAINASENMMEEVERDYPELQMDVWRAIQTNSGRALRLARQRSEVKVIQRRANYDDGLVRAQKMAISIGGFRRYETFSGFNLDSFQTGAEDHYIGNRQVYARDPLDDLELDEKFWTVAKTAVPIVGLEFYLRRAKWDEDDIATAVKAHEELAALEQETEPEEDQLSNSENGRALDTEPT